jgi:hypothetical protein
MVSSSEAPHASNVVPFRGFQNLQCAQRLDREKTLSDLEFENAQLRTSAIQLAIAIQELQARRRRSFL